VCKRRKNWRRKRQLQCFGFAQTSWKNVGKDWEDFVRILDLSEALEQDESNYKQCSCPSSWGHSWPKYQSQTTCTRSLTRWENLFQTTNLGQTGALNAKSRRTKNSRSTENTYRGKERPASSRRQNNF